ncbi:ankyrin repeat domain-containing protein [Bauldia litoralis]|uniref:ankyrin repeat domain-containing protein n=1 Tax=Bauldia litoralis TaxID=665467 RepID=UPI00326727B2
MKRIVHSVAAAILAAFSIGPSVAADAGTLEPAILSGDAGAVRSALAAGADPNEIFPVYDTSALMLAAIRGDGAMVLTLLAAGADPNWINGRGYNALSAAARSCRAGWDVAAALLDAGADIDNRSGARLTPLMVAIQEERPSFFRGLVAHGADINAVNAYGEGALNYAIYYRQPEYIATLLDRDVETAPLRNLFQGLYTYYYPNFGDARPQAVDCAT